MSPYNLLEQAFNQLLINPRSSEQEKEDLYFLKSEFEKAYGSKNYFLIPSSGSSRKENESVKLIALHHSAVMSSAKRVNSYFNLKSTMPWGCVLPIFHVSGLGIYARAFNSGAVVQQIAWEVGHIKDWLIKHQIQLLSLVPTQVFDLVQKKIEAPKILKHVFIGGTKLNAQLKIEIQALGWPILETYGMTETASMIAVGESANLRLLPDVEVALQADQLKIKCDSLMMCSLQKINQKTEIKTLTSGWFQTEDLAELSNQGQHVVLNLLGRNSDYIKINAEGVSLEHLREIFGHSLEFALLAIPNERREHEIVVVHAGVDQIQNAVTDFNKKVKPFERIRRIYAVNEIPLSELKKILYKKIELMIKDSPYEKI